MKVHLKPLPEGADSYSVGAYTLPKFVEYQLNCLEVTVEITLTGRNVDIKDRFRKHTEDKLSKITQFAPRAQRVEVELTKENNPRLVDTSERIEITVRDKGPVVRAEASASDWYSALDLASARLFERLRRARDRKKDHRRKGHRPPYEELAPEPVEVEQPVAPEPVQKLAAPTTPGETVEGAIGDSPVIVRQKLHETTPMSVDQALYQMELVGHPFYLFIDSETSQPCAVYHRHGWTYGVIRLDVQVAP